MTQYVMQAREGILAGYLENCYTCILPLFLKCQRNLQRIGGGKKPHKDGWFYERQPEHQNL